MNKVMFFHIIFYNETARAVRQGRFFWLTPKPTRTNNLSPPNPRKHMPPPIKKIRIPFAKFALKIPLTQSKKFSIICLICGLSFAQFALKSQHLCKKIAIGFPVCKFCITFAPAFMPRWRNR